MIRGASSGAGTPPSSLPLPAGAATEATLAGTLTVAPREVGRGAFGGMVVESLQPVAGFGVAYDRINGRMATTRTTGSGSVSVVDGLAVVTTTAAANSSAPIETRRALRYVNGVGGRVLAAGYHTPGGPGSRTEIGLGDVSDFLGLGYDGAAFGIWHRRQGRREIRTLTVTVGSGGAENVTVTLDGAAKVVASGGALSTTALADLLAAQDWSTLGAGWDAQAVGATVVFLSRSAAPRSGAYSLASTGTAAGTVAQTTAGAVPTETHYPQASWSEDTCSWLDPQKGNVGALRYQWLGFGELGFLLEDPALGLPVPIHRVRYANANTVTSLRNPQLPVRLFASTGADATAATVRSASAMAFRESLADVSDVLAYSWNAEGAKTSITTEAAVLSVRNALVVNGAANRTRVTLTGISCHGEGTGGNALTVRIWRGATIGGTPSWSSVNADSVCHQDTGGTTVSDGTRLWSARFARSTGDRVDLTPLGITLAPGEHITVTMTSASNVDASVSLTWREEL